MEKIVDRVRQSAANDEGATMVEYGFLLLLIALVAVGAVAALGAAVPGLYSPVLPWLG